MGFSPVGNFLGKFLGLQSKQEKSRGVFEEVLKMNPKINFNLVVKNKTIFFYDLSPAAKSELFLKRMDIIKKLKKEFGDIAPDDINFRKPE